LLFERVLKLTARQLEVLDRVIAGSSNKEIAADLRISLQTTKWHVSRLMIKYRANCRAALVREAVLSRLDINPTGWKSPSSVTASNSADDKQHVDISWAR
jgi:DNA-binding CsgD family transcriptional regulator